jgi:hypothetical protein
VLLHGLLLLVLLLLVDLLLLLILLLAIHVTVHLYIEWRRIIVYHLQARIHVLLL